MFELLYDPIAHIHRMDKHPSFSKTALLLLAAALFFAAGTSFFGIRFLENGVLTTSVLVATIVAALFGSIIVFALGAFLLSLALVVLGGKGGYHEALSALTIGFVPPSVLFFFAGALSFIPVFGRILAALGVLYGLLMGIATSLRALHEFFDVDYITICFAKTTVLFAILGTFLLTEFVLL